MPIPGYVLLPSVSSTNDYAAMLIRDRKAIDFQVIRAEYQSAGKGQKGSSWESEAGQNLMFTIILFPTFLDIAKHFYLSVAASLGIADAIKAIVPDVSIKWPNDIYVGRKKLGGMLIENGLERSAILHSIIGIGLNVNQQTFCSDATNPVSLHMLTGMTYDLEEMLLSVYTTIKKRFTSLQQEKFKELREDYCMNLLGYGSSMQYEANGKKFNAVITGFEDTGEIHLKMEDGAVRLFGFKEVSLVV